MRRLLLLFGLLLPMLAHATDVTVATDNFASCSTNFNLGSASSGCSANWKPNAHSGPYVEAGGAQPSGKVIQGSYSAGRSSSTWIGAGSFTADQYAKITLQVGTVTGSNFIGVSVRASTSGADTGYYLYCNHTTCTLAKVSAGTVTSIQSGSVTVANGDVIELRAQGTSTVTLTPLQNGGALSGWSTSYTDSSSPLTTGSPGVMANLNSASLYAYSWEGGNVLTSAATPVNSLAAGFYAPTQSVALTDSTTGAVICYTTDGSTPTTNGSGTCTHGSTYSSAFNIGTVGSSAEITVKAVAGASGYADSDVLTTNYLLYDSASDVGIVTDNFASYIDPHLAADSVMQFPMDSYYTNGKWKANYNPSGLNDASGADVSKIYAVPVRSADCTASSGGNCVNVGATAHLTTYTGRTGFANNQQEQVYLYPSQSSTTAGLQSYTTGTIGTGPGVRCATDGTDTGYQLLITGVMSGGTYTGTTSAEIDKRVSGTLTTLASVTGLANIADGSTAKLVVIGTSLGGVINGTPIAGLYVRDSSISSGAPCFAGLGYGYLSNLTAGNVTTADGTSLGSYSPTYPTYTDAMNTTGWQENWPWFDSKDSTALGGVFSPALISGSLYGIGTSAPGIASYRGGQFGSNQWQKYTVGMDPYDIRLENMFAPLQHRAWVAGLNDRGTGIGGCSDSGNDLNISCYDQVAYYPGTEKHQYRTYTFNDTASCSSKAEYCGSPFFHITKVTPVPAQHTDPNGYNYCALNYDPATDPYGCNNVLTVAASLYTPLPGDVIYEEYVAPQLNVACKGNASNYVYWQANHTYAAASYIIDSLGNWQRTAAGGTSGGTQPGSWGAAWIGTGATSHGAYTTDNTVTWEYAGQPCPTNSKFSWVIQATDSDLAGGPGIPALWGGAGPTPNGPMFHDWSAGTATSSTACTLDANLCSGLEQPHSWMPSARRRLEE